MKPCRYCHSELTVTRVHCHRCGVQCEGEFTLPRLARLAPELQSLAEQVLLAGGNLKEVAAVQGVSYPTLRKRIDALIGAVEALRASDQDETERLLGEVEAGRITPEYAARRIGELNDGG
ncbi:MAG: DUF2089 family protein [Xanthomonadales bacterium]|nr:DUF2089 family protein [Xanthomonadales bacterium]